jgi:hypothetical protein
MVVAPALLAAALVSFRASEARAQEECLDPESDPPQDSIRLYSARDFGGACIQLRLFAFPHAGYWNFGNFGWNDRVWSVKVGTAVRVKMFADVGFAGYRFTAHSSSPLLPTTGSSSARIEEAARAEDCSDVMAGEFAVWEHAGFGGDCFVIQAQPNFGFSINQMGFANDSVSAFRNFSNLQIFLGYNDPPDGSGIDYTVAFPGEENSWVGDQVNDKISTVGM